MRSLIEEIQQTLIDLVGSGVRTIPALLGALIVLALTRYGANLARRLTGSVAQRFLNNRSLQTLLTQIGYITAWIVGILVAAIIAFPGLALGDIVGLLGLGSVAIGFAFQDIFKNFLAGILLLLQQPFRLGDQIVVNDYEGTVEEIALRSTQIRTYQGEVIVIPNSIVFTNSVQVRTAHQYRRTDVAIGVDYNTPLEMAIDVLVAAANSIDQVLENPAAEVDIVAFGDSAIDLVVRYWTAPQQAMVRRTQTQVMLALKQACDQADINIPYPIRTLYFFNQDKYNDHYSLNQQDT
ncbi:MAG: mechanosensitive ion channel family protein [Leptolyngbyaceae cyanobacterium SM1_1_3]|nr:mechanosensitive ion channel family protein [Leptolyngbyaceae cyanobacterium SM1_1_3]NJM85818.1 mechanosensitive ion channel family protein [Leptolyngbyaceae cyanobacterium RM2_2_21]NJN01687.1 mechanosensitive ion channel family protein [Leptolyngbyaceae cyanobacterium RM1_1_2]NJO11313.1 mechanosensitive ion channel family protein [Leptolyngbyaceae cyanobacterium SL_1_1]